MVDRHPPSSPHLPLWFTTAPGQTDVLLVVMGVFLVLFIFTLGVLFLRLHHLPDHIAGKSQKVQHEIVAVLVLLAMLTHVNAFWIIALLLALIDLPDFGGPLNRIAHALERFVWKKPREQKPGTSSENPPHNVRG
ncbi:hypothetical protein [Bradyrhizobium centrolobii]|uniref:hypothetical protein n=1 Tax=Bradyrhizobium centrolobii TaxID=1505087 RepID=UPI0010A95229|nr:hypothetical protein [Bradyrhizobium centrolobii]